MAVIGIICPLWAEAKPLLSWHPHPQVYRHKGCSWVQFPWRNHVIVAVVSKVGSGRAGKATRRLLAEHRPQWVVNFGSAGAVSPHVGIGTVVVGTRTAEYLEKPPQWDGVEAPPEVSQIARRFPQIQQGTIVSADQNIEEESLKQELWARYQALCGDWESAVVMKICKAAGVPAFPFRVITDLGNEAARADFEQHHKTVLKDAADLLQDFLGCFVLNVLDRGNLQ